jgi:hypothetical protein
MQPRRPLVIEPLEHRILCKLSANGDFVIAPPNDHGVGHATIHEHAVQGLIGLRTADANSNGVVNWQRTD